MPADPFLQLKYIVRVAAELPANFLRWVVMGEHALSRRMFWERLGYLPIIPGTPGKRLLIDANGHGEYNQIHTFLRLFKVRYPDWAVVLMSWNPEIVELASTQAHVDRGIFAPWDISGIANRYLRAIHPAVFVSVDQVRLPFVVKAAKRLGARTIVISACLPEVYITSVHLKKPLAYRFYADFDRICVADDSDRVNYERIGCDPRRLTVSGYMKFDAEFLRISDAERVRLVQELGLGGARGIWVAGSVRPGEEGIVLDAFAEVRRRLPGVRLILAPRYVKDVALAQAAADARGVPWALRSLLKDAAAGDGMIILDTYGELSQLYGIADVTFIGNSLLSGDRYALGQNMAEPLVHGKPIFFGPHMNKWRKLTAQLKEGWDKLEVRDAAELADGVCRLLSDAELCGRVRRHTQAVASEYAGAVERNFEEVARMVDAVADTRSQAREPHGIHAA